jgi:hypothetical protein
MLISDGIKLSVQIDVIPSIRYEVEVAQFRDILVAGMVIAGVDETMD